MYTEEQGSDAAFELEHPIGAEIVNACGYCGRTYTAEVWMKLPTPPGGALSDMLAEGGGLLVHRDCACGSTMSIALIEPEAT